MEIKKVLIAPDSFKGTMNSIEVCDIISGSLKSRIPDVVVISIPVADGGEGTAECFLIAKGGRKVNVNVKGPFFDDLNVWYALINDGKTAIVELAACAGLSLVEGRKDPCNTTTYGVGQMALHAANSGAEEIYFAIGGSCTNDGGCGCAAALGVKFFDKNGIEFVPVGESLVDIETIDVSGIDKAIKNVKLNVICDVDNPLFGENGAAYIFAPQKGADGDMVRQLDEGLRNLAEKIKEFSGKDIGMMPGAGAAGGIGGGLAAFFDCRLESGIQTMLDVVEFEEIVSGCSLVLTGEGKIDSQSLRGKVVAGVAERTKPLGIPVIAIVGDIGDGYKGIYEKGVSAVVSTNRVALPFDEVKNRVKSDLSDAVTDLVNILILR